MLTIDEFADKLIDELKKRVDSDIDIQPVKQKKVNDVVLTGISFRKDDEHFAPIMYIDNDYYQYCNNAVALEDIVTNIIETYTNVHCPVDENFINNFLDFNSVKNGIRYKVINTEKNMNLLQDIPHRNWEDISIVLYYEVKVDNDTKGSITISNEMLNKWGMNTESAIDALFEIAKINTQAYNPCEILPVHEMIKEILRKQEAPEEAILSVDNPASSSMLVCSNPTRTFGAAILLYDSIFSMISSTVNGQDLYIIPSSIHELIVIPVNDVDMNPATINAMINEVNASNVLPEEVLSNNLYYYDAATDTVKMYKEVM